MTRDLLEQALDALEKIPVNTLYSNWTAGAAKMNLDLCLAIRAHLAKPERPVNCGSGHCSCIECTVAQETCKWTEDAGDMWQSSCGSAWAFTDGGPAENGVNFCHGCGKPVEIVRAP